MRLQSILSRVLVIALATASIAALLPQTSTERYGADKGISTGLRLEKRANTNEPLQGSGGQDGVNLNDVDPEHPARSMTRKEIDFAEVRAQLAAFRQGR